MQRRAFIKGMAAAPVIVGVDHGKADADETATTVYDRETVTKVMRGIGDAVRDGFSIKAGAEC